MQKYVGKLALMVMTLSLVLSTTRTQAGAAGYGVSVNGTPVWNTMGEMRDGQLMVSVRPYMEAFGGSVSWSAEDRRATLSVSGSQLAVWIGSNTAYQDGLRLSTPVIPYIRDGKTMVPAWWLAVRFGSQVGFNGGGLNVQTGGIQRETPVRPAAELSHPLMKSTYYFPFPVGAAYEPFYNTWGDPRSYQDRNFSHEGTDILARKGTPLVAVASGTVVRYGWNTLGGYRLTVQLDDFPQYRFYYAHMDRYAPGLYQGAKVKAGQPIGYVGSTGEGPERTEGKFVPHIHFGIYGPDGVLDPFRFLKYWEGNRKQL